jgi:gas vesicle protein
VGAILGATVALLLAPASGDQTRHSIARRFRGENDDVWEDLAEELELAAAEREEEASLSAES